MKQNVLLIIMDQFRGDLLGDGPLARAVDLPNLRALMADAVSFRRHYSVVTPCGPSRVSLLTGQYASVHGATRNGTPLRHDTPTLATAARHADYIPMLYGYTDTAQDPRVLPAGDPRLRTYEEVIAGFEEKLRMRMESDDTAWQAHLREHGITLPPYPERYRPSGPDPRDPAQYPAELSDTAFLTDRFIDDMSGQEQGWFAALTYIRPHPPLVAPAPYNRMYAAGDMPPARRTLMPAGDRDWHPFLAPAQAKRPPYKMVEGFPDLPCSEETTAMLRALYLGLASEVDHHIGRVVRWLKQTGQWDDTLLVVTADHGEMLGDFELWGKDAFYDATFHVPLIIRDPSRPASHGRSVDAMTESVDVMPTILDAIGADIPASVNGHSLAPLLEDPSARLRGHSVSEYDFGHPVTATEWMKSLGLPSKHCNFQVLRTDRHHLVQFAADLPAIVFDMAAEGETRDIAGRPGSDAILLELTQKLLRHRMCSTDPTFSRTIIELDGPMSGTL